MKNNIRYNIGNMNRELVILEHFRDLPTSENVVNSKYLYYHSNMLKYYNIVIAHNHQVKVLTNRAMKNLYDILVKAEDGVVVMSMGSRGTFNHYGKIGNVIQKIPTNYKDSDFECAVISDSNFKKILKVITNTFKDSYNIKLTTKSGLPYIIFDEYKYGEIDGIPYINKFRICLQTTGQNHIIRDNYLRWVFPQDFEKIVAYVWWIDIAHKSGNDSLYNSLKEWLRVL